MDIVITEEDRINLNSAFLTIESIVNKINKQESNVRAGWSEAFKEMRKNGDDELLIPDVFEDEEIL